MKALGFFLIPPFLLSVNQSNLKYKVFHMIMWDETPKPVQMIQILINIKERYNKAVKCMCGMKA